MATSTKKAPAKKATAKKAPAKKAAAKKTAKKSAAAAPPWEHDNPKGDHHQHLDPKTKAAAKRSAAAAGRPYPNLVDNMNAAKKKAKK